jgi:hypothetical protein
MTTRIDEIAISPIAPRAAARFNCAAILIANTAFVLAHPPREAIEAQQSKTQFHGGEHAIHGACFSGRVKPAEGATGMCYRMTFF